MTEEKLSIGRALFHKIKQYEETISILQKALENSEVVYISSMCEYSDIDKELLRNILMFCEKELENTKKEFKDL